MPAARLKTQVSPATRFEAVTLTPPLPATVTSSVPADFCETSGATLKATPLRLTMKSSPARAATLKLAASGSAELLISAASAAATSDTVCTRMPGVAGLPSASTKVTLCSTDTLPAAGTVKLKSSVN